MTPDELLRISYIIEYAKLVATKVETTEKAQIKEDLYVVWALVKLIENIGESAKGLTSETRTSISEIPWRDFIRTRDRFSHGYYNLDFDLIWKIAIEDTPHLLRVLTSRFPDLLPPPNPRP